MKKSSFALVLAGLVTGSAFAAPVTYKIDPAHSYPAFEADHFGGLSVWRGKFNRSSGTIVYDREARSGTVEVNIETKSIDMGLDAMNEHATSPDLLDAAKYPTATFKGKLAKFNGDKPTEVQGELTLHGVTKPVTLKVNSFQCKYVEYTKKDTCGADASATINREAFGISYGKDLGFRMDIVLRIGVEAHKAG
jgi:polyisoprenoid-binding protein YceI